MAPASQHRAICLSDTKAGADADAGEANLLSAAAAAIRARKDNLAEVFIPYI